MPGVCTTTLIRLALCRRRCASDDIGHAAPRQYKGRPSRTYRIVRKKSKVASSLQRPPSKRPKVRKPHRMGVSNYAQQLIPLTRPTEAKAAGVPVETEQQLRWLVRTAEEKGLSEAFVRIGRRVFLDPAKFHELVRNGRGHSR